MKTVRSMVLVSSDPESQKRGSAEIFAAFERLLNQYGLTEEIQLSYASDIGNSAAVPLVMVYPEAVIYGPLQVSEIPHIVEEHLYKGRIVEEKLAPRYNLSGHVAWLQARKGTLPAENRVVLKNVGIIDPDSIDDYIVQDGYQALGLALTMKPEEIIKTITDSGLQGRGGAGFPTGLKWSFVRKAAGAKKYVICNADESEPGTFKDRVILEGDPHRTIEAMLIAGYAVGADEGFIYIRGEYQLALQRLEAAIKQAESYGFLGENIFGSGFSFHMHVHAGAGAYICGEETALIESLEGKRGEPRSRPPYPTTEGLWGKPTLINNVETLANIPPIIRNGPEWYRKMGTASSPGTKVCTILGNVHEKGLIEVPMGITLREIITIYAKGMKDGNFKMAQTGGSGGSIIPSSLQDTPMDFESYRKAGVSLGSGALLICNDSVCIVDLAIVLTNFFRVECCGKCTPCRIGTKRAHDLLIGISKGQGKMEDLAELENLGHDLIALSNCGLGQTAGTPLKDMFNYFRAEVEAHVKLGICPCGICQMHD
ncbi:MAG: NADH-quinone oxidoreductase subunit NuoF [Anaerolineaceae bacterium]|nr:NADH-quinone oxidoreductase subunit NuoF [Anaerolineaceae bacterium]